MVACKYPQKRNWSTGRCKTPCKRHQVVNPCTGKCVTKTYLKTLMETDYLDRDEFHYDSIANHVGENPSDLRDGLVEDISCYPRKRNLLTGMCKTPCESHMAINPATGQCVTKAYLRTLDFDLYEKDEEDTMAANILFRPTIDQSIEAAKDDEKLRELIKSSAITVADARVVRGIYQGSGEKKLIGIYDHTKRRGCETSFLKSMVTSDVGKCGITSPQVYSSVNLQNAVKNSSSNFVWITGASMVSVLQDISNAGITVDSDLRLLIVNNAGILRLLVPKEKTIKFAENFLENNRDDMNKHETLQLINQSGNGFNMTIHEFTASTLV